jgi:tetratricopeptide (TPR) repeat protein
MTYDDYTTAAQVAGELFDKGDYARALDVFEKLIASDICALDKAMMCHNAAMTLDKLGRNREALLAYDRAIAFERPYSRCESLERKAAFLAGMNDARASLALYEELLGKPFAMESEKHRFRTNIETLRQRLG